MQRIESDSLGEVRVPAETGHVVVLSRHGKPVATP